MGKSPFLRRSPQVSLTNSTKLFILEGIPAIFCGIYTFFFLPNCESYIILTHCYCSYVRLVSEEYSYKTNFRPRDRHLPHGLRKRSNPIRSSRASTQHEVQNHQSSTGQRSFPRSDVHAILDDLDYPRHRRMGNILCSADCHLRTRHFEHCYFTSNDHGKFQGLSCCPRGAC